MKIIKLSKVICTYKIFTIFSFRLHEIEIKTNIYNKTLYYEM